MGVEDYNKKRLEQLREHKIAFDQEAMWAAMQKKKKRKGAFFFITMALVALAIVFFVYLLFFVDRNIDNITLDKADYIELSDNIDNALKRDKMLNRNADNENDPKQSSIDKKISNSQSVQVDIDEKSKAAALDKKKALRNREQIKARLTDTDNSTVTKRAPASIHTPTNADRWNPTADRFEITKPLSKSTEKNSLDRQIDIHALKIYEFPFLESLNKSQIDLNDLDVTPTAIIETIKVPKSRFQIGIYGGVGYLFRQTSLEIGASSEQNLETLEEISGGLELKYQLNPRFYIHSGIAYWQATERKETFFSSIQNIQDLETPPTGFTSADNGIILTNEYSKIHTIYQSYNIPMVLGWNTNNAYWNVFAEGGILYNFHTQRRRDESLITTENDLYNIGNRSQITPLFGIGASYRTSNRVELFVKSNWRGSQFVTNRETRESLQFGAIRAQIGVRIGI